MADKVNVVTATSTCPNVRVLHLPPTARFSKNPGKVWLIDSCRGSAMPARVEKLCLLERGWCPKAGASPQPKQFEQEATEKTEGWFAPLPLFPPVQKQLVFCSGSQRIR